MNKLDKQLSYAPAELQISYCGRAKHAMRQMADLFKKQIVLLCYEEARSVEELSEVLQIGSAYVQDAVSSLTSLKMMKKLDGKYLTIFPMLHLRKKYQAKIMNYKLVQELEIPKKINDLLFSIKDSISSLDFYGKNFDLSYLNWFLYTITNNCMISEFRSYYSDKTDEVILNNNDWRTYNYDFSICASYNYADEKVEKENQDECIVQASTLYNSFNNIQFNNVFDYKPFPCSWNLSSQETGNSDFGRNNYLTSENIAFYLNLVRRINHKFTEVEKKCLEDFEKHGVVEKDSDGYKPMIPVFTEEVFSELEKIITKAVIPLVRQFAEAGENKIEKLLLPEMRNIKERIDQFYTFWLCYFLSPIQELYWYGMNVKGLTIPRDYRKSVAGMYIVA